jgi:phytol kinase
MYIGILSVVAILLVVILANYSSKHNLLPKEISRKLPHVTAGIAAAICVFLINYEVIILFNVCLILLAFILKKLGLFNNLREVGRLSWGEFFIPIGIIATALLNPDPWVFCAAMLLMGIADAAAAIIGTKYGNHSFVYLGHKKSLEGSAAFFVVALVITALLLFAVPSGLESVPAIIVLIFPIVITAVEALAPFGSDNLLIPFVTAITFTFIF